MKNKLTGFVIVAGHLDIEWYQPLRSYRFWTVEALERLKTAAKREDFACYVLDGQVFPLEEFLEVLPEERPAMEALIKSGKLAVGPFYTQFDEWLPSAECMIRNCLYGQQKCAEYGGRMTAGYLPDNFGHPLQLPQILNAFGIDSLMFMRGMPEISGGHPDEFWVEGLDGSRLFASHFRESYSGAFDMWDKPADPLQPRSVPYYDMPEYGERGYISFELHKELANHDDPERIAKSMIANVGRIKERYPSGVIPLIAGWDHLPPQANIGDSIRFANDMQDEIDFIMGSAEDYVRLATSRSPSPMVYKKELLGSRYQYVLLGALSTRGYLKRQHFGAEALIERYAEPLSAVAARAGYQPKPLLLTEAWRDLLINSAHDSIHGSSTDEVHTEMESRYAAVRQIAAGVVHETLGHIGRHSYRFWKPEEKGVLAYAPTGGFPQPLECWLAVGDADVRMTDAEGNTLPTQVLPRAEIETNGRGEPRNDPFPDAVFRRVLWQADMALFEVKAFAAKTAGKKPQTSLSGGDRFIENEFLRVEVDGGLINLTDKRTGRTTYGLNLLDEEADAGDAWDFSVPWIAGEKVLSYSCPFTSKLSECGAVRAVLDISGCLNVPERLIGDRRAQTRVDLPVSFMVTLYRGIPRVDVKLCMDNTAQDHRIRLRVSPGIKTDTVLSQGHLAVLQRLVRQEKPQEEWVQPPSGMFPFREWAAVCDGKNGLVVAFKGVYDYETVSAADGDAPDLCFTLLRGIGLMGRVNTAQRKGEASHAFATPGAQCSGPCELEWSYIPYAADAQDDAPFLPLAQGFLYPPVTHAVRSQTAENPKPLPAPAVSWENAGIQFSAFKIAENGSGYVLRVYENQGRAAMWRLSALGWQSAMLCSMDEMPISPIKAENGCFCIPIGAYKSVSVLLVSE